VPLLAQELGAPPAFGRATAASTGEAMPLLADDILHVPLTLLS
jgi:hypothetical protein